MIRARKSILLSTAVVMTLGACTTGPMVGQDDPNKKTKAGVAIGAATGAIAGRLLRKDGDKGEKNRATVAGAAIGAAAGGLIGNKLDQQEAELRQSLGNDTLIQNTGDRLIVTMPQDILFASDSAELRPGLQADLVTVAQSLNSYPDTTVQVVGHTDNTGSADYNFALSQRRATSVANVLMAQGVPGYRLQTIGRGEDQPIASNLTEAGKAQNRRVEIVILPNAV